MIALPPIGPRVGAPTYLRAVVTTACPLQCSYCHMEGDPYSGGARGLERDELITALRAASMAGIRKFKFLGGEPMVRRDLPEVTAALRRTAPEADISVISSGVVPPDAFSRLIDAGLDRVNLSVHGWGIEAFLRRGGTARKQELRAASIERVLTLGRPLKLNYVLTPEDEADLGSLLAWAAERRVLVNVLNDLGDEASGPDTVAATLVRLRGPWQRAAEEIDPDSLPTTRLHWADGLTVEVKTSELGTLAPWRACALCPQRLRCREGIHAVRLTHRGRLQPCMDRPDIALDLRPFLAAGEESAAAAWREFVSSRLSRRAA